MLPIFSPDFEMEPANPMARPIIAAATDHGSSPDEVSPTADDLPSKVSLTHTDFGSNSRICKTKRIACMHCRKRKLKCDGAKPSCNTCSKSDRFCMYSEVRKKSGPKRGYVKALEERLKQVETLLSVQKPASPPQPSKVHGAIQPPAESHLDTIVPDPATDQWPFVCDGSPQSTPMDEQNINASMAGLGGDAGFTWEMISLGLLEPLPPQAMIDELHELYFTKVHPSVPIIHKLRYMAAMNLSPVQRPPTALRYAMWTLACNTVERYQDYRDVFYQRARKYLEIDAGKDYGDHMLCAAHAQAHLLVAVYELRVMYFPRSWMSTGAAIRTCQMTLLHRLDGAILDVKQCNLPPRDLTETEERRRTFWMAFCLDRYLSVSTGWPMVIDEQDIYTNLPMSENAFDMSQPEQTMPLEDGLTPSGAAKLSSFGSIVLTACLFGRKLHHLHRPDMDGRDNDMNGAFWRRHRAMDNTLLNTSLCLPPNLRIPDGVADPSAVFANMCIQTSIICLHQAAIDKAEKNNLPPSVSAESKFRCITAANETVRIIRLASRHGLAQANPMVAFNLYVAARVYVQYLKCRPGDIHVTESLRFLLSTMNVLKRISPLSESLLVQLDADLEILVERTPGLKGTFPRVADPLGRYSHLGPTPRTTNPKGRYTEGRGPRGRGANVPSTGVSYDSISEVVNTHGRGRNGADYPGSTQWFPAERAELSPGSGSSTSGMTCTSLNPGSGSGSGSGSLYDSGSGGAASQAVYGQMDGGGDSTGNLPSMGSNGQATDANPVPDPGTCMVMRGLVRNSFEASTAPAQQNFLSGGIDGGIPVGVQGLYNDTRIFPLTTPESRFAMDETQAGDYGPTSTGWSETTGQAVGMTGQAVGMTGQGTGMTTVSQGVLRTLMSMDLDMSQWTSAM